MQIRTKVVIAVLAGAALVAVLVGGFMRAASERNIRANAADAVRNAQAAFAATERAEIEKLAIATRALAADPRFQSLFARRDRAGLLAAAEPLFAELKARHGVTHWYFHLPDRTVFLRVHRPDLHGDKVERSTLLHAAQTGKMGAGKELGATAFALRVVVPWIVDGSLVGYLELAEEIDGFLERMKEATGDDYCLLIEKRRLDRKGLAAIRAELGLRDNWDDLPETVHVDSTLSDHAAFAWKGSVGSIPRDGLYLAEEEVGGRVVARGIVPVDDAEGLPVGALMVHSDVTRMHDAMVAARGMVLGTLGGLSILSAVALVALINALVFARLRRMRTLLEDVSARLVGGDYDVARAVPPPVARDEIGGFEEFFGRFIAVVAETIQGLEDRRKR